MGPSLIDVWFGDKPHDNCLPRLALYSNCMVHTNALRSPLLSDQAVTTMTMQTGQAARTHGKARSWRSRDDTSRLCVGVGVAFFISESNCPQLIGVEVSLPPILLCLSLTRFLPPPSSARSYKYHLHISPISSTNRNTYISLSSSVLTSHIIPLRFTSLQRLSSNGSAWDEIDFEFLGNLSGDPYILHTNVFSQGKGNREQQFYLWFDPTADFHTYSILWNPQRIIFSVDGTPIREFKNAESISVPFPKAQPMRIFSSLWNADDWATRGGLVKTDWTQAPFTASYRNFNADNTCIWSSGSSSCTSSSSSSDGNAWLSEELDSTSQERLKWVQSNYMIYNYCTDAKRFPQGLPRECAMS
ncbi:hypothetical protein EUGRSUZ_C00182 [Eucalyptus grandis]|uniref:Xyloglucan endotransglucosylase/hydrolase n=2 Tax=Eucalyptus grandis TaxID=71139 RepID=A0A059CKG7_EUCGR|nr:hypothetical protein EUGRSUZ_C00182 [Eucalyptus grandis]